MQEINNLEQLEQRLKELSEMTSAQIAEVVLAGGYVISNKIYFDYVPQPSLADGWTTFITRPSVNKKPRSIFITATEEKTKRIWNEGQAAFINNSGLPADLQDKWLNSTHRSKYILLKHLVKVAYSNELAKAYLTYRTGFTGAEYSEWAKANSIDDHLSPKSRAELVELIKEFKIA